MSKYIDADALLAGIYSDNPADIMLYIANQPEAIVRCKDCKHRQNNVGMGDNRWCDVVNGSRRSEDFCSYGERK